MVISKDPSVKTGGTTPLTSENEQTRPLLDDFGRVNVLGFGAPGFDPQTFKFHQCQLNGDVLLFTLLKVPGSKGIRGCRWISFL